MRPTERDLMVARAVRNHCMFVWARPKEGDAVGDNDLTALIESLPEPAEQQRCRCGWVSVEGGEIIDPLCPVHDVPAPDVQAQDMHSECRVAIGNMAQAMIDLQNDVQAQDWWITLRAKLAEIEWAIVEKEDPHELIVEMRDLIEGLPKHIDVQALRGQIESEVLEARKRIEAALHAEIVELKAELDAAVARERERWVEAINLMVTNEQVREVIIGGVDRARSGAKGA